MTETTLGRWPLVRKGARDDTVEPLQHLLNTHSEQREEDRLAVDGSFGPETEAAVKVFQETEKLTVDGIVGPETWDEVIVPVRKRPSG